MTGEKREGRKTGLRVVLDTNIYLSSLLYPEKKLALIWKCAIDGCYVVVSSHDILREIKGKLREKFD